MFYGISKIQILHLALAQVGPYAPQYRRPFITGANGAEMDRLQDALRTSKLISPELIAAKASNFMTPVVGVEEEVFIPGGWDSKRLRFELVVETTDNLGTVGRSVLIGYTDKSELDDDTVFHINNIVRTQHYVRHTPEGLKPHARQVANFQLLNVGAGTGVFDPKPMFLLRPEDVIEAITSSELKRMAEGTVLNTALRLTQTSQVLTQFNSPAEFISQMLAAYQGAQCLDDDDYSYEQTLEHVKQVLHASVGYDPVLQFIETQLIQHQLGRAGEGIAYGVLKKIWPGLQNAVHEIPTLRAELQPAQPWNLNNFEGHAAAMVLNGLSAVAAKFALRWMSFQASNENAEGALVVQISRLEGFTDPEPYKEAIAHYLKHTLLMPLCLNNNAALTIEGFIAVLGNTSFSLKWNGQDLGLFRAPTFCNSLWSPMLTRNENLQEQMANDFHTLFNMLDD